jgi:general secretion pathway protein E
MPEGMPPPLAQQIEGLLLARGLLSAAALDRVRRLQSEGGERLDRIAAKLGLVSERDLAALYAETIGAPLVAVHEFPPDPVGGERIRAAFLKRARMIPIRDAAEALVVAMADPFDDAAARALEFAIDKPIARRAAMPADIDAAYQRLYGSGPTALASIDDLASEREDSDRDEDLARLRDLASEAPVIRLVNAVITRAVEMGASDIHLEAGEARLRLRYRIDGVLREIEPPPARLKNAVISRIKIMAKLNIAERRLPQDGRIRLAVRGREIDFRVSTTPAIHGESVVLRILDRGSLALDFAALGFAADLLPDFIDILNRPHGIVLVTGPTGSGKTTTLYAALTFLNRPESKLLTVEDPVEYLLDGVNQVQIRPQIGLTFADALRSFLRQDPDILMVGEIRDRETAEIAVQAALTGHLVLSTVHTNDAPSAITRLLDMGIADYLLTSTLNAVLAQRLVRRLCRCRVPYRPPAALAERLGFAWGEITLFKPGACVECGGTGYRGRTMILELMPLDEGLHSLILRHADAREMRAEAVRAGMRTMYAHGLAKALEGVTSIEEVIRVTHDA